MKQRSYYKQGGVSGSLIAIILLSLGMVIMAALSIWMYMEYDDATSNLDSKVKAAVAIAERDQQAKDQAAFLEEEKKPNTTFAGPDDFGAIRFSYPKTWSVYVADDGSANGTYLAYLSPGVVPSVDSKTSRFATRVSYMNVKFEKAVESYKKLVEKGELKSQAVTINGQVGTRFDGNFDKDTRGAIVLLKIRDRTLSIATDANTFMGDYNKLLKTVTFND
ncbi:hypothetical protein H6796_00465 [Candidatus Nomurabacteria bacterium]|nr:hypothetical protein [Candidatus Nomurabacteria bacterium]